MSVHRVEKNGDMIRVVPAADIVANNIADLRSEVKKALSEGGKDVVVDLSNTTMVDSTGIGFLVAVHNSVKRSGGKLSVVSVSKDLFELFKSMRMDRHFTISSS